MMNLPILPTLPTFLSVRPQPTIHRHFADGGKKTGNSAKGSSDQLLGQEGDFPDTMEPWVAREIINHHLASPAMWAIFPIQDLLAMDAKLRCENTQGERINVPAIAQNYWRYRMHLKIEDLLEEKKFNSEIMSMINASGRGSDS